MIYQISDMMSISTWGKIHFWMYLLNHNSSHQTWPTDTYNQGQQFLGIFWTIWRTGTKFQVFSKLAICPNYSITNYVKIPVLHFFLKRWIRDNINVNYQNGSISPYWHFNKSFPSPTKGQKHVRNVCHTAHKYLTKFHSDST